LRTGEKASRVIVSFARAVVERKAKGQFDVPAPSEGWISGKIDIDQVFTRFIRLSYLAPDITHAILDGRQPRD
jgi:hypothetical protein